MTITTLLTYYMFGAAVFAPICWLGGWIGCNTLERKKMNTDIVTINEETEATERAYRVVLDRVKQIRADGSSVVRASEVANYYGVPISLIRQIFKMIYNRRALSGKIIFK